MKVTAEPATIEEVAARMVNECGAADGRLQRLRAEQDAQLQAAEVRAHESHDRQLAAARADYEAARDRTEEKHRGQLAAAAARFDAACRDVFDLPDAVVESQPGGALRLWVRPGDVRPVAAVTPVSGLWAVDGDPAGRVFVSGAVAARRRMWEAADAATAASRGRQVAR